jgi:hypothetical protein
VTIAVVSPKGKDDDHSVDRIPARSAATRRLLLRSGCPVTLVVNKMPRKGNMLNVDLLGKHIPQARGLVVIPRELEAASQLAVGRFDWRDAPASWQERCAELVVSLLSDWPRLGLAL